MRTRARVYRVLLWLYPPKYRREYGEPMLQHFTDRLRRGRDRHTWFRTARDLAVSVPYEHWESFMATSHLTRAAITVSVTGAAALTAVLLGVTIVGLILMLLLTWQLYAILQMRGRGPSTATWWHFLVGGAGLFATIFVVFALPWPESWRSQVPGDVAYYVVVVGIALALVLVAVGLVAGIARLIARSRGNAPA